MEVWRDEGREGGWGEWVLPHSLLWLFAEACNPVRVEATFFARAKKNDGEEGRERGLENESVQYLRENEKVTESKKRKRKRAKGEREKEGEKAERLGNEVGDRKRNRLGTLRGLSCKICCPLC